MHEEAIGSMPKGLKEGIGCVPIEMTSGRSALCGWVEHVNGVIDTEEGNEVNVGSFGQRRGRRGQLSMSRAFEKKTKTWSANKPTTTRKNSGMCCQ